MSPSPLIQLLAGESNKTHRTNETHETIANETNGKRSHLPPSTTFPPFSKRDTWSHLLSEDENPQPLITPYFIWWARLPYHATTWQRRHTYHSAMEMIPKVERKSKFHNLEKREMKAKWSDFGVKKQANRRANSAYIALQCSLYSTSM